MFLRLKFYSSIIEVQQVLGIKNKALIFVLVRVVMKIYMCVDIIVVLLLLAGNFYIYYNITVVVCVFLVIYWL
jgi:hypothetical protein